MIAKFKKIHPDAQIPMYATEGSAGFDFQSVEEVTLHPGQRKLVKTGLSVELPIGLELQVRSRSGNALKLGIIVLNSPGTVDSDYRGEIGVILHNTSIDEVYFEKGSKIAQGVITPYILANIKEVDELSETKRGKGGFGSTDKKREMFSSTEFPESDLTLVTERGEESFNTIDIDQYQKVVTKILKFPAVHQDLYLLGKLIEETGEISKLFVKRIEKHENIDTTQLKLEVGDVLWVLATICKTHDILMSDVIEANLQKLKERNLL